MIDVMRAGKRQFREAGWLRGAVEGEMILGGGGWRYLRDSPERVMRRDVY